VDAPAHLTTKVRALQGVVLSQNALIEDLDDRVRELGDAVFALRLERLHYTTSTRREHAREMVS
jgi:hypothetical protein